MFAAAASRAWAKIRTDRRLQAILVLVFLSLGPRLWDLGSVMSVDEPLWRARAYEFTEGLATFRPAKTFTGGQPGVTTMWVAGLAAPFRSLAASQAAIALSTTALLLVAVGFAAKIVGPLPAFAGGVFMALDPFVIAHSRVVHTDALLGAFMLVSLLALARAWQNGARRDWVYAGVAAAGAALSKQFGMFLLLPLAAAAAVAPRREPFPTTSRARRAALVLGSAIITVLLAWPALLFTPRVPLAFMTQRVSLHAGSAEVGSGGGDTWYYPREFARRLTPVATLLAPVLVLGLLMGTGRRLPRFPGRRVHLALLGTALLYVLLLSLSEQKGDRYILIAHLTLDLALGATLVWLAAIAARVRISFARAAAVLITLVIFIQGLETARLHPHYHATWNRLLPIPWNVKYGWGEGLELAAAYFRSLGRPVEELRIASYYPGVLREFLPAQIDGMTRYQDPRTEYLVLYRSMFGRSPDSPETDALTKFLGARPQDGDTVTVDERAFRLEQTFVINRIPYVWIFRQL